MKSPRRWTVSAVCIALALSTWLVFGQTLHHDFINYDDGQYVYKNPQVIPGLTREGFIWAFSHRYAANWHPLTWISHMLDCHIFGLRAGGHHFTNVLLHGINVLLLFLVLRRTTARLWRSAFVAALFAIHPLRVESVAWIAERKDLLSGLFFLLTLGAYTRYARAPSRSRYAIVLVLFALGLMCKPMLVTLPIVLLLVDYWPLDRFDDWKSWRVVRRLVIEKLSLLVLSAASIVVTLFAQTIALQSLARISLPLRLGNALVSTAIYIRQMFWPTGLVLAYPFARDEVGATRVLLSLLLLLAISAAVYLLRRRRYLVTGWLWYLIMLLPVIGVVQVGAQAHADRYTYLPQIGLALALTWGTADLIGNWSLNARRVVASLAVIVLGALAVAAHRQTSYWRDSETLWRRTLAFTSSNSIAEQDLGEALHQKGETREAIAHFERALAINPHQATVHSSLGVVLLELGQPAESLAHLETATALDPNDGDAQYNLGNTLMAFGRDADAVSHYRRALEQNAMDAEALNNMAWLLATSPDAALRDGSKAVEYSTRADALTHHGNARVVATLAAALAESGRFNEAVQTGERATELAKKQGDDGLADSLRAQIASYRAQTPFRSR